MQKKIKISIEPIGKRVLLEGPANGLDVILEAGIDIKSVCAGKGTCGKCRIIIMDKDRKPPNSQESKILGKDEIGHGVRLACQQIFDRDLKVYIPASSLSEEQKLQVKGEEKKFKIDPPVKKYHGALAFAEMPKSMVERKKVQIRGSCPFGRAGKAFSIFYRSGLEPFSKSSGYA